MPVADPPPALTEPCHSAAGRVAPADSAADDLPAHRSYNARRGRLSAAKRRALDELGPRFALQRGEHPGVVDLGCGTGEVARHLARTRPDVLVLAVDVHSASVATLLRDVADEALANLRVHHGDGVELLRGRIEPASLALLTVLFPDPWPKARHRHRRLVEPGFAALAADRLADGGVIRLATDRHDYATQMRSVLAARPDLEAFAVTARSDDQPVTFYEARAQAAGRPVHELAFVRRARNLPGPTPPDD